MTSKQTKIIGLSLFLVALGTFTASLFLSEHMLTLEHLEGKNAVILRAGGNEYHAKAFSELAEDLVGKPIHTNIAFIAAIRPKLKILKQTLNDSWAANKETLGKEVEEWTYKLGDYNQGRYLYAFSKYTAGGTMPNQANLFFLLSFILGSIGALIYYFPSVRLIPGIKHNGIYHHAATKGVPRYLQLIFVVGITIEIVLYASSENVLLLSLLVIATTVVTAVIAYQEKSQEYAQADSNWRKKKTAQLVVLITLCCLASYLLSSILMLIIAGVGILASLIILKKEGRTFRQGHSVPAQGGIGWIGVVTAIYFIAFYVLLYTQPAYISNWILMVEPIKQALNGGEANEWFLYGLMYSSIMLVTAVRVYIKYRHNRHQKIRTASVVFFQILFAFLLPEMLANLKNPGMWATDLKNAWPLNYASIAEYNLKDMEASTSGTLFGIWMILLSFILIPILTYIFGKRFYCSWVCGCGGLAETLGDPYRQLSDKSLRAWRIERWTINGVMVLAFSMTLIVLIGHYAGVKKIAGIWFTNFYDWYAFLIGGTIFAGIIGTGFYPIMGNRVWCRFGCPLAAMMGLVQRFKSRFRITTNGGQCISCGNCSTYCEMGIDVRHYAQRSQAIVRSSCVGCGVCAAVCPRGVLRLENSSEGIHERTKDLQQFV